MQIDDPLKVKFSAAQNEEKANLKAELAYLYEVQNESAQKVAYSEDFFLKSIAKWLEINLIFKINAKLLPSLPKSRLAALISASF